MSAIAKPKKKLLMFKRYRFGKTICKSLQGVVRKGRDIITGDRICIKSVNKKLLKKGKSKNGNSCSENIIKEAKLLSHIDRLPHKPQGKLLFPFNFSNIQK